MIQHVGGLKDEREAEALAEGQVFADSQVHIPGRQVTNNAAAAGIGVGGKRVTEHVVDRSRIREQVDARPFTGGIARGCDRGTGGRGNSIVSRIAPRVRSHQYGVFSSGAKAGNTRDLAPSGLTI